MKKNSNYLKGASTLAISVIVAKILGALYRVPLTYFVGAEGMGIYQFVYPIFALLLTLSCGAMPTAVSITISRFLAKNDSEGAKNAFYTILTLCIIIGVGGMVVLALLAYPLSLLQSKDAFLGYITVAPAVCIVSIISVFRGYFMGHNDMTPSSISQVSEGIVKLCVGVGLTYLLLPYGVKFAVCGALFGVVASELVTLIILFSIYLKKGNKLKLVRLKNEKSTLKELSSLSIPLVLCGLVLPMSQFLDSVILVNLLVFGGVTRQVATQSYGVLSGTISPLINLPVMVCITLGIAITPQMVEGKEKRDTNFIMEKVATSTKITLVLGVPFVLIFLFLSEPIITALYPSLSLENKILAVKLLRISAISVLGLSIFQIYSAMFQGLDKPYIPLKVMIISVTIKLVLNLILVPKIGIVGGAISSAVAFLFAGIAIMFSFFNYAQKIKGLIKNTSLIALCGVIMSIVILTANFINNNSIISFLIGIVAIIIYILGLFILGVFNESELRSLPLGVFWLKLDKILHHKRRKNGVY